MKHRRLTAGILLIGLLVYNTALAIEHSWRYAASTDAEHWSELDPEYALCRAGKRQSPINIEHAISTHLPALKTEYFIGPATVKHTGHTLELTFDIPGQLTVGAQIYDFVQLHFHTPSGEQIKGRSYPLVAHLVHRSKKGKLAVIAILMRPGKAHPNLAQLLAVMPRHEGDSMVIGRFDVANLFPANRAHYTYNGSLPAPPCTEGVRWYVLKTPVEVSEAQINAFQLVFPMNARDVQPTHKRVIRVGG